MNRKYDYDKKCYVGVGFLGGETYSIYNKDKTLNKTYKVWYDMLRRGYEDKYKRKHPTYKDCTVCEEWHNFQNFAKWYEDNYYEVGDEVMCLDKDILVKHNKIYSPEYCIFVPQTINKIVELRSNNRGDMPVGVYNHKKQGLIVQCSSPYSSNRYLGTFKDKEEAFLTYKYYKEGVIKRLADDYKDKIPQILYKALYNYKIEISD